MILPVSLEFFKLLSLDLFLFFRCLIIGWRKTDLSFVVVYALNADIDVLTRLHDLARMVDTSAAAEFRDMDQAVDTGGQGDESAELGQTDNLAGMG